MESRQERVARNESLFRQVNERIEEINRASGSEDEAEFICECGDASCTRPITMSLAEYEAVRMYPAHFAVATGHDSAEVERVVAQRPHYAVVAKHGAAERVAVETDPRA